MVVTSKCCGDDVNFTVIKFYTQFAISIIMLIFCMVKMWVLEECDDKQFYSSTLTAIVSYWVPSPKLKRNA
jgi:hypothetical protein